MIHWDPAKSGLQYSQQQVSSGSGPGQAETTCAGGKCCLGWKC